MITKYEKKLAPTILLIPLLPDLFWILRSTEKSFAFFNGALISCCILIGGLAWTQRRLGILLILALPWALLAPFEIYYIHRYGGPSSAHIFGIIGESNPNEIFEFIGIKNGILFGISIISTLSLYIFTIKSIGLNKIFSDSRCWRWISYSMLIPLATLALSEIQSRDTTKQPKILPAASRDVRLAQEDVITSSYIIGLPLRIRTYFAEKSRLEELRLTAKKSSILTVSTEESLAKVITLVIGESARPDHWHVNGYHRETTPTASSLSNAISLNNVVSPWSTTRYAVPALITGVESENGLPTISATSLIDILKAAGWKTYWISNQAPLGFNDSSIKIHAEQADYIRFMSGADYKRTTEYDHVVIPEFEKSLASPHDKKLIIIHLLGSHWHYKNRYPPSFSHFIEGESDNNDHSSLINHYDNSILYTDFLLGEFIHRLEDSKQKATLFYLSDHGQNLPNSECGKFGHSHHTEDSLRVAALVWLSSTLAEIAPAAISNLNNRISSPLHTLELFHTILDISGVRHHTFNKHKSWMNQEWIYHPRLVLGIGNFDDIKLTGACKEIRKQN